MLTSYDKQFYHNVSVFYMNLLASVIYTLDNTPTNSSVWHCQASLDKSTCRR